MVQNTRDSGKWVGGKGRRTKQVVLLAERSVKEGRGSNYLSIYLPRCGEGRYVNRSGDISYISIYLSIHLFIYLSIYLSIYLYIYLSIYLST